MTDETPRKRNGAEMMELLVKEAEGLARYAEASKLPGIPAQMAAYKTALRIALEIFNLDPEAGRALLEEDRRTDFSGADMVQAAREVIYDIPADYLTEEEVRQSIKEMREHVSESQSRRAIRRARPATHSWGRGN